MYWDLCTWHIEVYQSWFGSIMKWLSLVSHTSYWFGSIMKYLSLVSHKSFFHYSPSCDMDNFSCYYIIEPKYCLFWAVFSWIGIICVGTCELDILRCLCLGLKVFEIFFASVSHNFFPLSFISAGYVFLTLKNKFTLIQNISYK